MSKASPLERLMLDLVNEERREAGLDPLLLEHRLNASSETHTDWMLRTDRFTHEGMDGSLAVDRIRDAGFEFEGRWKWGENIALQSERGAPGLTDDVRDLHEGLMDSPGHRKNILDPNFEVMGVGIETGDYKGYNAVAITQNFARTAAPLRVDGGDGPSSEPAPKPEVEPAPRPAAPEGDRPAIEVADFQVAPGGFTGLGRHADYSDADGDAALRYEIDAPDGARVKVAGKAVDASDGHVFAAADFGRVVLQFDPAGDEQTYRMRVEDRDGWSDWDAFTISAPGAETLPPFAPMPAPDPAGRGLGVEVDDIVLRVGERAKLVDHIEVATGGAPVRSYKIEDADGGPGLWNPHRGAIDASEGAWLGAAAMNRLQVVADDGPSVREMRILANDGEHRTDWVSFTVTTELDLV